MAERENPRLGEFAALLSARIDALRPKALNISREAFQEFAQFVPAIIWTATSAGDFWFNEAFHDFTGGRDHDYRSRFHPEDLQRSIDAWDANVRVLGHYTNHVRVRGADGEYHWVITRARPVMDCKGELSFWIGSSTVMVPHLAAGVKAA